MILLYLSMISFIFFGCLTIATDVATYYKDKDFIKVFSRITIIIYMIVSGFILIHQLMEKGF